MACLKLKNYLRTYRKRAGLSQDEVAFLVGCCNADHISRFEHSHHLPSLRILLAYRVLFRIPTARLFGGLSNEVEQDVRRRARDLVTRLKAGASDAATARKLIVLGSIVDSLPDQHE